MIGLMADIGQVDHSVPPKRTVSVVGITFWCVVCGGTYFKPEINKDGGERKVYGVLPKVYSTTTCPPCNGKDFQLKKELAG